MSFKLRAAIFFFSFIWLSGIFIEFLIPYINGLIFFHPFLNKTYSLVCHQESQKLISYSGMNTLVCARCVGIYAGFFISSFFLLFFRKLGRLNLRILAGAAVPMIIDVLGTTLHFYNYSKNIAFFTGFLLGSVGILYLYKGIENIIIEREDI